MTVILLDELYVSLSREFSEQCGLLEKFLIKNGLEDYLSDYQKIKAKTLEEIEPYKRIDTCKANNINIIDEEYYIEHSGLPEYEKFSGFLVPKPTVYKKTIEEELLKYSSTDVFIYRNCKYQKYYLPLSMRNFYWGVYKWEQGDKFKSCEHLMDALKYILFCVYNNDENPCQEYLKFKVDFGKAARQYYSSLGGKARSEKYKLIQKAIKELLKICKPEEGWKSIVSAVDDLEVHIQEYIEYAGMNINDNDEDKLISLRDTIIKWASTDLKNEFSQVIVRKRK
ncbi:hypothetical protein [Lelliottia wanjuensis]|uniref:Uncharacterized protein n=1 Tax=Lelliottia wanjuensis TaxID=3050585 RepID=A0AAP4D3U2_9ENTR|nr:MULTISPECIES: hypothetical protein [unclassified Lelliottia]MDK9362912.1 hypothetical protein [Lelliottia sp. V106_12]MDK9616603.1 hypothetical protein [Lelliottia sp. V106_9]